LGGALAEATGISQEAPYLGADEILVVADAYSALAAANSGIV
jgi:hypothetical protein